MTLLASSLLNLETLEMLERTTRELHDVVCGPGHFLAEQAETALHEFVADGIRDQLYRDIGERMVEVHLGVLKRLASKETKEAA